MHVRSYKLPESSLVEPDAVARALFCGWLPLLIGNAVLVGLASSQLDGPRRALHYAYDAGQLLGLAVLTWLLAQALSRLSLRIRVPAFCVLAFFTCYGLLGGDLESFLERHPQSQVPWRVMFAAGAAIAIGASLALGRALAPYPLRWLGVAIGAGAAIGNHLVLQLAYPGTHFAIAWCAAALIGASLVDVLARVRGPRVERAVLAASAAAAIFSYAFVPGPVVRSALLTSSGAIAAPFITRVWAGLEPSTEPIIGAAQAEWFRSRKKLAPIPAPALPGAPSAPTVILLTIDGLRSDVVYGPEHASAVPNLRAMAKRSLWFSRVWSPAAYTMASMHSFFTGTYRVQLNRWRKDEPSIAELLERAGVHTVNVPTIKVLAGGGSIARGFGEERSLEGASSERVVDEVLACLAARPSGPLFIFSHVMDPHAPYDLGGKHGSQKQRYVGEVSFVDKAIGRLRRELDKRKLRDSTYLIVSSDHGEAFGEHGRNFHATTLYEEMIRIPLLIEGPGVEPRQASRWVSLIDVGPTVLSLFGVATPGSSFGQSLVPFMRGDNPQLTRPLAVDGVKIRALLIDERWKAMIDVPHGTEELYDLKNDPGEHQNLAEAPYASAYFATLRAFFEPLEPRRKEPRLASH